MKKKTLIILFAALTLCLSAAAQTNGANRAKWLEGLREHKHTFLAKELGLTKDQQREFFPLYDEMEDEVERINAETRETEERYAKNADASELELEHAARTVFEQKRAEGQIEMTYFEKFKEILSPKQLISLKNVERKFTQKLLNHRPRVKGDKKTGK